MSAPGGGTPAAGYCRQCGKMLTPETLREVQGAFYCPDCLAAWVSQGQPRAKSAQGRAATAATLGIIPGLGAVYNGEYVKALIHVLVFGVIIRLIVLDRAPELFIPMLVAWIFYMPFEAYQTAKAKATLGGAGQGEEARRRRETLGPILLIVIGSLALLSEWDIIDIGRIVESWWPVGLIALGVWLLAKRQEG